MLIRKTSSLNLLWALLLPAVLLALLVPSDLLAQGCAMCKATVESEPQSGVFGGQQSIGAGLNKGILLLMVVPYILLFLFTPFGVVILVNYIRSLPKELAEAAALDGCGYLRFVLAIVFPLIQPAVATVTVLHAIGIEIHRRRNWRGPHSGGHGSVLYKQFAWHIGQPFNPGLGDQNGFGDLKPHIYQP